MTRETETLQDEIWLEAREGVWHACHRGPHAMTVYKLFGTFCIPTAFTEATDIETVAARLRPLNPGYRVTWEGRPACNCDGDDGQHRDWCIARAEEMVLRAEERKPPNGLQVRRAYEALRRSNGPAGGWTITYEEMAAQIIKLHNGDRVRAIQFIKGFSSDILAQEERF